MAQMKKDFQRVLNDDNEFKEAITHPHVRANTGVLSHDTNHLHVTLHAAGHRHRGARVVVRAVRMHQAVAVADGHSKREP
jgi:hypothetical protein